LIKIHIHCKRRERLDRKLVRHLDVVQCVELCDLDVSVIEDLGELVDDRNNVVVKARSKDAELR
jgi:hypothetical protein